MGKPKGQKVGFEQLRKDTKLPEVAQLELQLPRLSATSPLSSPK